MSYNSYNPYWAGDFYEHDTEKDKKKPHKNKYGHEISQHMIDNAVNSFKTDVHGNLHHSSQKNQHDLEMYVAADANFSIELSSVKFEPSFDEYIDLGKFYDQLVVANGVFTGNLALAAGSVSFDTNTVHVRLTEVDVPALDSWPAEVRPVIIRQRASAGHLLLPVWSGFFIPGHDELADVAMLAIGEAAGDHWYSSLNGRTGGEGAALLERLIAELERDPASYLKFVPVQQSSEYGNFLSRLRQMVQAVVNCAEKKALWWEVK